MRTSVFVCPSLEGMWIGVTDGLMDLHCIYGAMGDVRCAMFVLLLIACVNYIMNY